MYNQCCDKSFLLIKIKGGIKMRAETDFYVKRYLRYLGENKGIAEGLLEDFDSEWEIMYCVFTAIFKISYEKALAMVDDFRADMMLKSITDE